MGNTCKFVHGLYKDVIALHRMVTTYYNPCTHLSLYTHTVFIVTTTQYWDKYNLIVLSHITGWRFRDREYVATSS